MTLHLEYMGLDELVPDLRNPKRHRLDLLDSSFDEFGFTEPVVIDERTGKLLSGHGRVEQIAARFAAGVEPPENVTVREDGSWSIPVTRGVSTKDDAAAAAYLIAANKISEAGGWDDRALLSLIGDLPESPLRAVTGFSLPELAKLDLRLNPPAPDEFPVLDPDGLTIEHRCPSCGYEWSGKADPTAAAPGDVPTDDGGPAEPA